MTARKFQWREFALRIAPPWLQKGDGAKVLYSISAPLDVANDWAWQGIKARMPLEATPTALGAIGRDRVITRGFDESDDNYRARLAAHLVAWRRAGHAQGILDAIAGYLSPHEVRMRIATNAGVWYTRETDGTFTWEKQLGTWDWDGASGSWWRFWVILYPPNTLWTEGPNIGDSDLWNGAIGSAGYTIGSTATPEQVQSIRGLVKQWKPAHAQCKWIIVAFDPDSFDPSAPDPDGTWGPWGAGDPRVRTRLASARYWDGAD